MAEEGVLTHDIGTSSANHRLENARCDYGGENVAHSWAFERVETEEGIIRTNDEERLAETLIISWMNSHGHWETILDEKYSKTGFGIVIAEDDAIYAAQKFFT